jgi:hypothetical protein
VLSKAINVHVMNAVWIPDQSIGHFAVLNLHNFGDAQIA